MGDLKLVLKEVSVTQQISFLVLICDAKTWSLKKRNKTVSDTGLTLCTDWVFDFVQEMGDLKLTLKGVGVTQQISSLVLQLICDATTWSQNMRNKTVLDTGLSVGARICIIIFCYCWSFIVSCQVFIFSSSLVSFVSYQFYTCYIYLHILDLLFARNLFGSLSSVRKISWHI